PEPHTFGDNRERERGEQPEEPEFAGGAFAEYDATREQFIGGWCRCRAGRRGGQESPWTQETDEVGDAVEQQETSEECAHGMWELGVTHSMMRRALGGVCRECPRGVVVALPTTGHSTVNSA